MKIGTGSVMRHWLAALMTVAGVGTAAEAAGPAVVDEGGTVVSADESVVVAVASELHQRDRMAALAQKLMQQVSSDDMDGAKKTIAELSTIVNPVRVGVVVPGANAVEIGVPLSDPVSVQTANGYGPSHPLYQMRRDAVRAELTAMTKNLKKEYETLVRTAQMLEARILKERAHQNQLVEQARDVRVPGPYNEELGSRLAQSQLDARLRRVEATIRTQLLSERIAIEEKKAAGANAVRRELAARKLQLAMTNFDRTRLLHEGGNASSSMIAEAEMSVLAAKEEFESLELAQSNAVVAVTEQLQDAIMELKLAEAVTEELERTQARLEDSTAASQRAGDIEREVEARQSMLDRLQADFDAIQARVIAVEAELQVTQVQFEQLEASPLKAQ